jgi:hypothetical protein
MIYELITKRNISNSEKEKLIKQYFKKTINNITEAAIKTIYIEYGDLSKFERGGSNIPISIMYQFIKKDILYHLARCFPPSDRQYILMEMYLNLEWNKHIFTLLQKMEHKGMMLWFFFCMPYFLEEKYLYEIDNHRLICEKMIDYCIQNWRKDLYFTEHEFICHNIGTCIMYPIVYQNHNNRDILMKYCKLLRVICPFLNYTSPFLNIDKYKSDRIKICFLTDSFDKDSCVLRDRIGTIGKLIKMYSHKYDIYIGSFNKFNKITGFAAKILLSKMKEKYIYLGDNLDSARSELNKYVFDIIVYPDIGMKLKTYILAYSRLAPIQITTWGHSETSGINTIDYYISSKYFHENPNYDSSLDMDGGKESDFINHDKLQSRFSEKLILCDSLSTYYIRPSLMFLHNTNTFKSRKDYNLSEDWHIYGCLQTFYKFNIEFEKVLKGILIKDPKAIIIISNVVPFNRSHLARLHTSLGLDIDRLKWFPPLDTIDYLNLINLCDIVLDPFPFGGCNTSFEAFDFGIPVVTYPSNILSGRFTYGLYRKMGIKDCIVHSGSEYIELATNIVNNKLLRNMLMRKINSNKYKIFQELESVHEYSQIFDKLFSEL